MADIQVLLGAKKPKRYAAADPRFGDGWSPSESSVNDLIADALPTVRARVRQLVRDFPYFARAVDILSEFVVGSGIQYQARVRDREGKLLSEVNQEIEDVYKYWKDEADYMQKQHFDEMADLAMRQICECGEFILVKYYTNNSSSFPFQLALYEPDWLTDELTSQADVSSGNDIFQGVEYNKKTGKVVAYHFTDPDGWGAPIRIAADRVIHKFHVKRPGQLRGISAFTPAILLARNLGDYITSTLDVSRLAAKYLAFIETDDAAAWQTRRGVTTDSQGRKREILENAILEYLNYGEKVTLADNPNPGTSFDPFVRLLVTMISITTGVPYELLSGDYRGMNYAVSRVSKTDFRHSVQIKAARHIRHFYEPIKREFLDVAILTGRLNMPDYFTNIYGYQRGEWQPPGMEPVDVLREVKANIDEIKAKLNSPQRIAKKRGVDFEDILRELSEAKDLAEKYGLNFDMDGEISTALANNPAKLENSDDAEE